MCVPRFDSPSVFGCILGRRAGSFRVAPLDVTVPADRRYLPGTMILETSWGTADRLDHRARRAADRSLAPRGGPLRHLPPHPERLRGRAHPAAHRPLRVRRGADHHGLRAGARLRPLARPLGVHRRELLPGPGERRGHRRRRSPSPPTCGWASRAGRPAPAPCSRQGDVRFVALSWGGAVPPTTYADAYKRQVWTAHHWQHWLARGQFPDHPWRSYLQRSALTLKGLTYAPTGAVVAAGSTSLPETPGGNRNYDYRFTWIRDATFALWGMYSLGFDWEAIDFFSFIADIAEQRRRPADHVRHRRGARARGVRARPPARLRQLPSGADRERRLRPAAARRVGRPARLGVPALQGRRPPRQPDLADPGEAGGRGAQALARARRRDLGGARGAAALHLVQDHVLGRRRPGRPAGRG